MRVFDSEAAKAASLQSPAARRQHVPVASLKSGTAISGVAGELSVERRGSTRQRDEPARRRSDLTLHPNFSRPRFAAHLDEVGALVY
jgi:hypothetical protein